MIVPRKTVMTCAGKEQNRQNVIQIERLRQTQISCRQGQHVKYCGFLPLQVCNTLQERRPRITKIFKGSYQEDEVFAIHTKVHLRLGKTCPAVQKPRTS